MHGSVKLLFQPAEEFGAGAKYMVKEGVMEGVDQVYGIHLFNPLETGTIGVKAGPLMVRCGLPLGLFGKHRAKQTGTRAHAHTGNMAK